MPGYFALSEGRVAQRKAAKGELPVNKRERTPQYGKAFWAAMMPLAFVLFSTAALAQGPGALQSNGAGNGTFVAIRDSQAISVTYVGATEAVQALQSGKVQPLSLADGDFNGDGLKDLVAGYATSDGSGIVVLHRGNLDAFAPQSYESWLAIGRGQFPSPFLGIATAWQLPRPPDFIATGHFSGVDHLDVVTAARGDGSLYLLAGDGTGNLAPAKTIPLPGVVSAMAAGNFGRDKSRSTVIVGIGGPQPAALVYASSAQGFTLLGRYALPVPATAFFTDDMDGDGLPDVVMIAGGQVWILHAVGFAGQPEMESLSLPVSAVTLTTGFFVHDRSGRRQIAVLDQAGTIYIVAHTGFDSRGWTKAEVKAMRDALLHNRPNPFARTEAAPVRNGWRTVESISGGATFGASRSPLLVTSRISGGGTDDVLILDPNAGQMAVAAHPWVHSGASSFTPANLANRVYSAGVPVAALSFPVNADARDGVVVLHRGEVAISVMMPIPGHRSAPSAPSTTSSVAQAAGTSVNTASANHREGQ
jgi:hypothetical protein